MELGHQARAASSSRISFGSMKRTSSSTVRSSETSSAPRSRKSSTSASTSSSGALAPEVMPTVSTPSSHSSSDLGVVVDQVRGGAVLACDLDQAVGVRGVRRPDHEDQVTLAGELLDGDLAVGRRVTDVVGLGADDRREPRPQGGDDLRRLVDREGRLGDEGDPVGIGHLEALDLVDGLDEDDVRRRLAGGPFDLLVALVADQDDRVAVGGEAPGLDVDLGHQRAGGVDRAQPAGGGIVVDRRGDAVGGEDDHLALRDLGLLLDEDRAPRGELLDHVLVVDDLLADVDRRPVQLERALDRLDGAVDPGAVAAGRGEQDPARAGYRHRRHDRRVPMVSG